MGCPCAARAFRQRAVTSQRGPTRHPTSQIPHATHAARLPQTYHAVEREGVAPGLVRVGERPRELGDARRQLVEFAGRHCFGVAAYLSGGVCTWVGLWVGGSLGLAWGSAVYILRPVVCAGGCWSVWASRWR